MECFTRALKKHVEVALQVEETCKDVVTKMSQEIARCLKNGGRIYWCGNGGSAADSQHFAAEFVGRYKLERQALPSIALTTDTSILTAVGNDYGFDQVFSRQVEGLVTHKDILVGISTSGNSKNILLAIQAAKKIGAMTFGFTGKKGGQLKEQSDLCLAVPTDETARIQEMHLLCGHILCESVDELFGNS